LSVHCPPPPLAPHSFPTRRSSDLDDLRMALGDRALPAERRIAVVEELMGGTALPVSVGLVSMVVGADRAGELPAIAERFLELSRSEEHTSELQSRFDLVCRLLLEK